ncbi:ABC transporter ATP-binding protein [Brevibacterium casei]|uniref:ABC transporter ATP-binding protein n=1 Tax=Brevibacterium casei TaxID=33889 RepID=UPI00223BC32C|nr:ABC transporter ATP-binding protein [Brevibacterium casei]MCT1549643.1 ABC transporter ATP-binding protein [Brevibacterium casei]MCT1559180.1 ABC transporter ATP-binding protein [Brevibacterium casei]MCT2207608.1 ABC transporter ATP-binding protein [Brevibacterium casei]
MIEMLELTRDFRVPGGGTRRALDHATLTIDDGETFGLLGPNGAGKTTMTKLLTTLLTPSSGTARVAGFDVRTETKEVRKRIGLVLGGERGLYDRISARQNLMFWGTLAGVRRRLLRLRSQELLEQVGLAERADEPVERFSRGMRQRLHLARGLISDPKVLFLDEPTSGMDPTAAREFRRLILEFAGTKTILLTTHDMREAEELCQRAALIDRGKLIDHGTIHHLRSTLPTLPHVEVGLPPAQLHNLQELASLKVVTEVIERPGDDGTFRVTVAHQQDLGTVLRWLADRNLTDVRTNNATLEEVYLNRIGDRGMQV